MRRALIALLALAACAAPAPQTLEGRQLDGTYWVLRDPNLHPQTAPTLRFVGARADGFAGCNRWSARITQANGGLRFEDISATEMACPAARWRSSANSWSDCHRCARPNTTHR